jgi:hypothetical protein
VSTTAWPCCVHVTLRLNVHLQQCEMREEKWLAGCLGGCCMCTLSFDWKSNLECTAQP